MFILAFETSCDDTSIAVFENNKLLAMETKSQIKEHESTCGVVPEVAARLHANNVFFVLEKVLKDANITLEEIDYIACTKEPGLMPSLYVGLSVAKTLSKILKKPLVLINHIEAHIFANLLDREEDDIIFPSVVLTVSGGHNELYLWKSLFEFELIGETQDDSAGEAFDKVAKMMGLGFPGGPAISRLAGEYIGEFKGIFPRVLLEKNSLNFSFSGLKSAVKREIDRRIENTLFYPPDKGELKGVKKSEFSLNQDQNNHPTPLIRGTGDKNFEFINQDGFTMTKYEKDIQEIEKYLTLDDKKQIAFEFENTVVDILKTKLFLAAEKFNIKSLVLAGGVSANSFLKNQILLLAKEKGYSFIYPNSPVFSQDNAAMVGILAYYRIKYQNF